MVGPLVCVLGEVHVRGPGGKTHELGENARLLLLALALRSGAMVPKSFLAEVLWGDETDAIDASGSRLRMAMSRLRSRLTEAGLDDAISYSQDAYRLVVKPGDVDADAFTQAVEAARQMAADDPENAAAAMSEALALWHGDAFGQLADRPWAAAAAAGLNELRYAAEEDWAALELSLGHESAVVDRLRTAVLAQPLRELRWTQLATAYYRLGRQTDALRALQEARRRLREDVGVEPGLEIRRLERAILDHHPGLDNRQGSAPVSVVAPAPIGRERDIEAVIDLLRHNRLVTILGFGGVGKTMLARTVQARVSHGVPAVFAALDGRTGASEVALAIAGAVGLGGGDDDDSLVAAIAGQLRSTGLLVLDGAEGCVAAVAALVDELGILAPSLRVLATSRTALGAVGEVRYGLDPLSVGTAEALGPAVTLFMARAGLPMSSLDATLVDSVLRACNRAAGLPLAIELIASSLDRYGLRSLDAASEAATEPVEQALHSALQVAPEPSRRLLLDAALLPDGVSLASAAALAGVTLDEVRSAIGPLAQLRLFEAAADTTGLRYRTLMPIREATAALHAGEGAAAQARVIAMLASYGTAIGNVAEPVDVSAVPAVEGEIGNLRHWLERSLGTVAGLERATAVAVGFVHLGMGEEAVRWLGAHRAALPQCDEMLDLRSRVALYQSAPYASGPVAAIDELRSAVALAENHSAWPLSLTLQAYLAMALGWSGDFEAALELVDAAAATVARTGDLAPWFELNRLSMIAIGRRSLGDFTGAIADLGEIIDGFDALGCPADAANARYLRSSAARLVGDLTLAREDLLAAKRNLPPGQTIAADALINVELAQLARAEGDPNAMALLDEAIATFDRAGNLRLSAAHRLYLGRWRLADGDEIGARGEFRQALPVLVRKDAPAASVGTAALARLIAADHPVAAARLAFTAKRWLEERSGQQPSESDVADVIATAVDLATPAGVEELSDDEAIQLILAHA